MTAKEVWLLIITYAIMAIIATVLLIGYCALVHKKEPWLLLLYICVTVVNVGYFLISVSQTVEFAIFANDVAYFGSVFLSMSMLLTIVKLCGFEIKKNLIITLGSIGILMFLVIATSGILPWYYKEVELVFVDGAAKLKKVYGVLHPTYLLYLLGYFSAMVTCIVQSIRKKMIASQRHAALLAVIVFGNFALDDILTDLGSKCQILKITNLVGVLSSGTVPERNVMLNKEIVSGGCVRIRHIVVCGRKGREERSKECKQDKEQNDDRTDNRTLVFRKAAERALPVADRLGIELLIVLQVVSLGESELLRGDVLVLIILIIIRHTYFAPILILGSIIP